MRIPCVTSIAVILSMASFEAGAADPAGDVTGVVAAAGERLEGLLGQLNDLNERLDEINASIEAALARPSAITGTAAPRFNRDVRPILSQHCFKCHGPDEKQRKAGLRLDTAEGVAHASDSGRPVVVPGRPEASELMRRVTAADPDDRMPPAAAHARLTESQIEMLAKWIEAGANYEPHWALLKPTRSEPPAVHMTDWPKNLVDLFILSRLEAESIAPSAEADKYTLIRRAYLDLIGLPPAPDAVRAFVEDTRPDAYERLVDDLLASPHFGERWARHWLDAARYADSNGYSIDGPRSIWKYRDWVIKAFNRDMPFDRFTIAQLAGDLLPDATGEDQIATGFHRNTMINQEGGIDPEEFRVAAVVDRVNTTATVFLGLTMACAQCHSHKYDPITQEEYFRFFAFFNDDDEVDLDLPTPQQVEALERAKVRVRAAQKALDEYAASVEDFLSAHWELSLPAETAASFTAEVQQALGIPRAERLPQQSQKIREIFFQNDPEYAWRKAEVHAAQAAVPEVTTTMVLRRRTEPRATFVHLQGDFTRRGEKVTPGTPAVLHPMKGAGRELSRLDLAKWLIDPENPLTARVVMNRFWQHLFGRGLVETENDFGTQGTPPSHPELLDWLATEFISRGWSMKAMIRLMVTSATYRQASYARADLREIDPQNRLLARQSRLRLEAEIIRDCGLAVSGLLNPEIGGPSVFPPIPDGVMGLGQVKREWNTSQGLDRHRRGMYTYFWRGTPHPSLILFDAPDAIMACTRRNRSNTPLQALTLLNDEACVEQAERLAARVLREAPENDAARVAHAFRLCLAREPRESEVRTVLAMLEHERETARNSIEPWITLGRVMLNLDEFITRE